MDKILKNKPKGLMSQVKPVVGTLSSCSSTGSTATIVQKKYVPDFVNNNNLRNHLHRSFDTRGEKQLEKIMNFNRTVEFSKNSKRKKNLSCSLEPNDLIIQEFLSISSKKVWSSVLNNFKSNPKALFNLIKSRKNPSQKSKRSKRLNNLCNKPIFKTTEIIDPDEDEVITFKSSENIPEDWSKSLLYWKVRQGIYNNTLSPEDIQKFSNCIPRTQEGLVKGIDKGLAIIESYLLEMLGTKEDMNNFKMNLSKPCLQVYESLYDKCLNFAKMRKKAVRILKLVQVREELFEKIRVQEVGRKEIIARICLINNQLKPLLADWTQDPLIPFSSFTFKNENYLKKLQKDNLIVQKYLIHYSS